VFRIILGSWLAALLLMIAISGTSFTQSPKAELSFKSSYQQIQIKQDYARGLKLNGDYFEGYISDIKSILISPSHWQRSDWIKASLITGITAGLYTQDQKIQDWVQENRSSVSDRVSEFAKPFGDGRYTLPGLGALYLYGHLFEDEKAQRTALLSLKSFVISGLFVQALKFTGHRHRPSSGDPYNTWDGPGFSTSNLSFPSGHSSSAFAIATVIASEYGDKAFVSPLAYGIATLTALSRVNDNSHWASDVFFGAVIGYFTAKAIIALNNNKINNGVRS